MTEATETPAAYARQIAYVTCPTTIRSMVLDMYGRAPSLEQCARYRAEYLEEKEKFRAKCEARADGQAAMIYVKAQERTRRNAALYADIRAGVPKDVVGKRYNLTPDHVMRIVNQHERRR